SLLSARPTRRTSAVSQAPGISATSCSSRLARWCPGDRLRAGRQLCQEGGYAAGAEVVEPSPPWFDRDAHLLFVHRPDVAFEGCVRVGVQRLFRRLEVLVGDAVDGLQMRESTHQKAFRGSGSITNVDRYRDVGTRRECPHFR